MANKQARASAPAPGVRSDGKSGTARSVKRSITVRPEIDDALSSIAGGREYSQVANEAFILYLQARGIDTIVRQIEAASGPLTQADHDEAERRLEEARRRTKERRALHR